MLLAGADGFHPDPAPVEAQQVSWVCLRLAGNCQPQGVYWSHVGHHSTAKGMVNVLNAVSRSVQVFGSFPKECRVGKTPHHAIQGEINWSQSYSVLPYERF